MLYSHLYLFHYASQIQASYFKLIIRNNKENSSNHKACASSYKEHTSKCKETTGNSKERMSNDKELKGSV